MKKLLVVAVAAMFAAGAANAYKDGSYEGEGKGRESTIKVQVVVKDQKVADVKILSQGETEGIFDAARDEILPAVVKNNGTKGVDAVAGASLSSKGIIDAVNAALAKAN